MAVPKLILNSKGSWQGKSKLHQSWLPAAKQIAESDSSLHIDTDEHATFATITYTWRFEDKRQEGVLIVCKPRDKSATQFAWADSWHQNTAVMHLTGEEIDENSVKTTGHYAAEGETWGWTIALQATGDKLSLKMENVTPKGEAEWAVEATYERA